MVKRESKGGLGVSGEQVLLQRAKKGEIAAFEALVNAYERRVYALALRSTGSEADAADITQEVFCAPIGRCPRSGGKAGFRRGFTASRSTCASIWRGKIIRLILWMKSMRAAFRRRAARISPKRRLQTANCAGSWTLRSA